MDKSELLNWLQEEQQQWEAFLAQIGPARMEQLGVNGDWSMKDIIAHLTGWEPRLIASIQAAQHGKAEPLPPWPAHLKTDDEINAWLYQANHGRSLQEVLDESRQLFKQLLSVIQGLPEDVAIDPSRHLLLLNGRRFPAGEFFDHFHDDHEPDVRAWLARVENE
jgi:hypothetical protein